MCGRLRDIVETGHCVRGVRILPRISAIHTTIGDPNRRRSWGARGHSMAASRPISACPERGWFRRDFGWVWEEYVVGCTRAAQAEPYVGRVASRGLAACS